MSLKDRLMDDLKTAMKQKDSLRKNAVQMVRAAILQIEKDKLITLDDNAILDVIFKEVKKRKDVLPDYQKSNRQDLIDDLNKEIEILTAYLPKQLSEDELDIIVKKAIEETNSAEMKDMGKVMSLVMAETKGRADGKIISALVKKYLV